MQKVAFLDRDGALIYEPPTDYQIDSLEKLQILDGVIEGIQELRENGYMLVMVTNQDGLGTDSFPQKDFDLPHNRMLEIFKNNRIIFDRIFICSHFPKDNCQCRKPKLGMIQSFLDTVDIDKKQSFVYGDRDSDGKFADNIGVRFF